MSLMDAIMAKSMDSDDIVIDLVSWGINPYIFVNDYMQNGTTKWSGEAEDNTGLRSQIKQNSNLRIVVDDGTNPIISVNNVVSCFKYGVCILLTFSATVISHIPHTQWVTLDFAMEFVATVQGGEHATYHCRISSESAVPTT